MVSDHYTRVPDLAEVILAAYGDDEIGIDDLAPVEEFHLGGAAATAALVADLELGTDDRVLDIGCGIGGPARRMAALSGCTVTGVDLTESFIEAARALSARVGSGDRVSFEVGDATALDRGRTFTAATLVHVGMNIADKAGLFAAVASLLEPGGRFAIYDIMRIGDGDIALPLPFASEPEQSFVEGPDAYVAALDAAGFTCDEPVNRTAMALQAAAAAGEQGPPPASLLTVMGPDFATMFTNLGAAIRGGVLAPVQIIARR